jgi:hypothetical protein
MKKIFLLAILNMALLPLVNAQTATATSPDIWQTLEKVTYKKTFDKTLGINVDVPVFGKSVKAIEGQIVTLKGYIIPLEGYEDQDYFIFSRYPYSMCFFCGGAGPETVMEVETKTGKDIKYTSKEITIKGKLKLNDQNVDRLMYILEDASLVK